MRRIITAREQAEMLAPWRRASYTDPMGEQDWNEIYPDLPDTVHRGIGITLPDELHRMVHDPSIPVEHRAQALLRHIGTPEARTSPWGHDWRQGLGTSWSGDDGVAEDFARRMADQHTGHNDKHARENDDHTWGTDEDGDPVGKPGTAVTLHAQLPQLDEIDDNPNGDGSGQRYTYHGHGEQEVPVHQGTGMHIKGISWRPVLSIFHPDYATDPEEYTHHEFAGGTYHQARRMMEDRRTAAHDGWGSLSHEDRVSVAENIIEKSGLDGKIFYVPTAYLKDAEERGMFDDVGRPDAHTLQRQHSAEAEDFVNGVLESRGYKFINPQPYSVPNPMEGPRIKVNPKHWDLREPGSGQAFTDGYSQIALKGNHVNTLTLLHEVAHVLHGTRHEDGSREGHGPNFQKTLRDLYHEHLGPEAASIFSDILEPPDTHTAAYWGF